MHNSIFTTILLWRFDKTLLMSFCWIKIFKVVVGAKFNKQYLQNATSSSIGNKQTKIDSKVTKVSQY